MYTNKNRELYKSEINAERLVETILNKQNAFQLVHESLLRTKKWDEAAKKRVFNHSFIFPNELICSSAFSFITSTENFAVIMYSKSYKYNILELFLPLWTWRSPSDWQQTSHSLAGNVRSRSLAARREVTVRRYVTRKGGTTSALFSHVGIMANKMNIDLLCFFVVVLLNFKLTK